MYEGESTNTTRILNAINNADIPDNNNPNTNTNINTNTNTVSTTYSIFGSSSFPCADAQKLNLSRSPPLGPIIGGSLGGLLLLATIAWYFYRRSDRQPKDGSPPAAPTLAPTFAPTMNV